MTADTTSHISNPTLGFFTPRFGTHQGGILDNYPEALWNGVAQAARERDASVMCFVGADPNSPTPYYRNWNIVYDLASPATLDGLIIATAIMQKYMTIEEMTTFCAHYGPLPVISIGLKLADIPSVTINNFDGMYQLVAHLIEAHGHTRIAFIRGLPSNEEAEARYQAYAMALERHGIGLDPNLIAPGRFTIVDGVEAIRLFLDERKISFDAVVACNDNMAIGAYQELCQRGFSIPEDVAVTGFDNIPQAKTFSTPLTSVRQPLAEIGQQAVRALLEHLRHGAPLENLVLDTELVIRESCGCLPATTIDAPSLHRGVSEHASTPERTILLARMQETLCPHSPRVPPQAVEQLVDAFFGEMEGRADAHFLSTFNRLLRTSTMVVGDSVFDDDMTLWWQTALSLLREQVRLRSGGDVTRHVEDVIFQASTLITRVVERLYANIQERAELRMTAQSETIRDIHAESDMQHVIDVLARNLSGLGVRSCFLVLYDGENVPSPLSRLVMAFHNGQRLELEPDGLLFPSEQLVPSDGLSGRLPPLLMIRPLGTSSTSFGFLVMEMSIGHQAMFDGTNDEFAEQVSSALHGTILRRQIEQSNRHLEQRADELAEVNSQLERFAYVVSHDLQEPLRMIASYLQLIERRYKDRLDSDGEEFIGYAVDGAVRMKRMINDILAYSRVSTREHPHELVSCENLLAQALSNLEMVVKDSDALITHDPLPDVVADSTQLTAVLQNLIANAIKFRGSEQPHVHVSAEQRENHWLFSVEDNGIGIAPQHADRVFDLFSRLHPNGQYPGSGIGLAICKKVVERHGGRIWLESRLGEGTTFFFTVPLPG